MTWTMRCLATLLLALGLTWCVRSNEPVPEDERDLARKAIVDLSNNLTARDAAERAQKIVKDFDSCDISAIFARRHGLGIGKLTEMGYSEGVEQLIAQMSRRKNLTEADLEKYRDDYLRVAKVMQAM